MPNPFTAAGLWYKGNLHTHTTESDGRLSPLETIRIYAEHGYDFLALTDHEVVTGPEGLDSRGLTLIPGVEMLAETVGGLGQKWDVLVLGVQSTPQVPVTSDAAELVAAIARQCELCFVAHPFWCLLSSADILSLSGHAGIEVYNGHCQILSGRGSAEHLWDVLLAHGQKAMGLAVDDAHGLGDYNYCNGWVMVKSADNTSAGLLAALGRGEFYSSTGPRIDDIRIVGQEVVVTCSPCRQVCLMEVAAGAGSTTDHLDGRAPFEKARLPLARRDCPFRVEVIDDRGRKAWSNPVFPDEMAAVAR